MNIAIISKLWEATHPFSTGGTGMSVGTLVNGLAKRGHKVTLFATTDSTPKAHKLISVKSKPYSNDYSEIIEYKNIANAFKQTNKFDLIHTHIEHKACFFAPLVTTPTLITLRYGEFFKDELDLLKENKQLNYSFNSTALQKKYSFLNSLGVVYNGLNLDNYPFNNQPQDYLLFIGRISPQKGAHLAIQAALKANKKLILAGKMVNTDKAYLNQHILPFIDKQKIIYQGEIKFKDKIKLLANASALIQPTQSFEACSNIILEAQACGTPVITFNQGSNKELVKNNHTGFITSQRNLVSKIKHINKINRQNCYIWIQNNFNQDKMIHGYERLYSKLIKKK